MIDWIDDNVAVGNWMDARNIEMLQREGIDIIVDSRIFFDETHGRSHRKPKVDLIDREVKLILALVGMGAKVLIRCYHGRDRSPFLAMVYVSRKLGTSYTQAYQLVRERRPITVFHWDWVDILQGTRSEPLPEDDSSSSD